MTRVELETGLWEDKSSGQYKLSALAANPSITIVNISNFQGIRQLGSVQRKHLIYVLYIYIYNELKMCQKPEIEHKMVDGLL